MRTETAIIRRLLSAMLVVLLFAFAAAAEEEYAEEEYEEEYEDYIDENAMWYAVRVSDPDGNGGGKSVTLEYNAELDLPQNGEYSWYASNAEGEKGELLAVTAEPLFETEAFEKPEIRFYLCELAADGQSFEREVFAAGFTGLPLIRIHTEDEEDIAYPDYYLAGTMTILDGETVQEVPISVKGRGNATFNYLKKPFTVKLEEKTSLLGMGKAKKWALLAGWCDKTLLRAALGFKVSELAGLAYTPDYRYVDLVVNGEYRGNYMLAETPKEEAKRLDISEGGYLVEETQYDGDNDPSFRTDKQDLRIRFRSPDGEAVTGQIMEAVSTEINGMEQALLALGEDDGLPEQIDADSWVNWVLVQNILANKDTNRYYYKTGAGSKICMGPAWDFEWSVGIGWYTGERPNPNHELTLNTEYVRRLMKNGQFLQKVKERWSEISPGLEEILVSFMDNTAREISLSRELNFCRWTIMNQKIEAGGIPMGSYEAELECDKTFLREHIRWLDGQIGGLPE